MDLARRLRELRVAKKMSQADVEAKTGLLRVYISRIENGHTTPSPETLEKIACAFGIPLYAIFYEGHDLPAPPPVEPGPPDWASQGKGYREFKKFRKALAKMTDRDRKSLLSVASKVARRSRKKG